MECPFCSEKINTVAENDLAYAIYDKYPVSDGHILIIPKRHFSSFFDASVEERRAMNDLLDQCKNILDDVSAPHGYNIGINCGEAAGQTIFHVHVHLIPRFTSDINDPRGGVRGVIPEKRIYE
ncbi:HIT family protein [Bacillus sp. DNRA2]|uniref:HIT family protein n=1 Tax=Bacillus sp. DNRA2 TaxID=2723053 RepID=UPI00145E9509|nr:HIT family protein [Bacillus sp. DNRA2]NMD71110.1 HIT family protein [Bacillus sp. DNRA2]